MNHAGSLLFSRTGSHGTPCHSEYILVTWDGNSKKKTENKTSIPYHSADRTELGDMGRGE